MINSLMPEQSDQMYSHIVDLKVGIWPFVRLVTIRYRDDMPLWTSNIDTHISKMREIGAIRWFESVEFDRFSGVSTPPAPIPYRYKAIEFIYGAEKYVTGGSEALGWLKEQCKPIDTSNINVGDVVTYEQWKNKISSSKVIRINRNTNMFKLSNGRGVSGCFIDKVETNND